MTAVHPVTLEVVRNALYAIAEEMSVVLMRSARSPLLKEAGDLSSALTDAEGRLIAQGRDIPIHMGVMGFTVKEFLKRVPASTLREGDVWFLNVPEVGGNHLPDVKALRPVFAKGKLRAFAVNLAHWADIGGAVPGSYVPWATECYQEGLRIAPIRLFSAAGPDREKLGFVLANLRGAEEREGDIFAQYAANDVAARRLGELFAEHGPETVERCFARLHDESETQMRAAIRALPDGDARAVTICGLVLDAYPGANDGGRRAVTAAEHKPLPLIVQRRPSLAVGTESKRQAGQVRGVSPAARVLRDG